MARCDACSQLQSSLTFDRGSLGDARKKLIRQQEYDDTDQVRIDHLLEQIADLKVKTAEAQLALGEHQAECDLALQVRSSAGADHHKIAIPLDELLELRRQGYTQDALAEHFGTSVTVVRRHLADAPVLVEKPPDWVDKALCAQTDPEAFYPEKGGSTREAKSVCARCTVAAECLTYALEHEERFGIWGGLSERERRRLSKNRKTA